MFKNYSNKIRLILIAIIILLIILVSFLYFYKINIISHFESDTKQMSIELEGENKTITNSLIINDMISILNFNEWKTSSKLECDCVPEYYIKINNKYLLSFILDRSNNIGYCTISYSLIEVQTYSFEGEIYNDILIHIQELLKQSEDETIG